MDRENETCVRIRQFILSHFPVARRQSFTDNDSLLDTGIIDSLGVLDMVNFIEGEFAINISDEELLPENFESIQALSTFVEQKKG